MDPIALAERSRKWAEQAEEKLRPRETNTPRKLGMARSVELDGIRLKRAASYLRAYAKCLGNGGLPESLKNLKPTKDRLLEIASQNVEPVSNGYHSYHIENGTWRDTSEEAECLRVLADSPDLDAKELELRRAEDSLRFSQIPGFFPTPRKVIDRMMELAELGPNMNILEPSAGKGDIADVIRQYMLKSCSLLTCEINPTLAEILQQKGHFCAVAGQKTCDFLTLKPVGIWHRILMNPPFERGQDVEHVQHAYDCLAPGGRLVAVMANGAAFGKFLPWLDERNGYVEEIPPGSFNGKEAFRQTGVNCNLVVIDKSDWRVS